MNPEIQNYNEAQLDPYREICQKLSKLIDENLPGAESKIWHSHPVWFLEGNVICGYSKLKAGIRLIFWSGADFEKEELKPGTGKFKDASIIYTSIDQINASDIKHWLGKAENIQWEYKNLIKRNGKLERLK